MLELAPKEKFPTFTNIVQDVFAPAAEAFAGRT